MGGEGLNKIFTHPLAPYVMGEQQKFLKKSSRRPKVAKKLGLCYLRLSDHLAVPLDFWSRLRSRFLQ